MTICPPCLGPPRTRVGLEPVYGNTGPPGAPGADGESVELAYPIHSTVVDGWCPFGMGTNPQLQSPFESYGTPDDQPFGFRIEGRKLCLRGLLHWTGPISEGAVIATMPVGFYDPGASHLIPGYARDPSSIRPLGLTVAALELAADGKLRYRHGPGSAGFIFYGANTCQLPIRDPAAVELPSSAVLLTLDTHPPRVLSWDTPQVTNGLFSIGYVLDEPGFVNPKLDLGDGRVLTLADDGEQLVTQLPTDAPATATITGTLRDEVGNQTSTTLRGVPLTESKATGVVSDGECLPCVTVESGVYIPGYGPDGPPGPDAPPEAPGAQPAYPSGATVRADGWCYIGDPGCGFYGVGFGAPPDSPGLSYRKEAGRLILRGSAQVVGFGPPAPSGPIAQLTLCTFPLSLPDEPMVNAAYFGERLGAEAAYDIPRDVTTATRRTLSAIVPILAWDVGSSPAEIGSHVAIVTPLGITIAYKPQTPVGRKFHFATPGVPV